MITTVQIGDKEIKLESNFIWAMEYREQFGKDIVPVIMPFITAMLEGVSAVISETKENGGELTMAGIADTISGRSLDLVLPLYQLEFVDLIGIIWAMAKAADDTIDPPKKWLRQFDDAFYLDVLIPEVFGTIIKTSVSSKNREWLERIKDQLQPNPLQLTT